MVVPFPAAGPADVLGRILAERMRVSLGQSVIVENVSGGAGSLATGRVARATPDGNTVLMAAIPFVINPQLRKLNYHPLKYHQTGLVE